MDEQSFSSTYAQMCHVLSLMSVRGNGNESNSGKQQEVKFRNLIINKCQKEFEKDNTEDFREERLKEIDACPDVSTIPHCTQNTYLCKSKFI